jgi:hypothetical protein
MDDLILIAAGLSTLSALVALLMRSERPVAGTPKKTAAPTVRGRHPANNGNPAVVSNTIELPPH